ncbi:MAG TPA: neutral zinc metallopeptidase [Pyrinomonadaceae bacterium]|nr:neutral zinc metallopeptidase [Pyrinomonadaceae bacterium]
MRLGGLRESGNVEDRRGMGLGRGGMAVGGGCGTLIIVVLALVFGVDPSQLLDSGVVPQQGPPAQQQGPQQQRSTDEESQFVRRVLGTTEDTWNDIFRRNGSEYREPALVLFTGQVQSACGRAGASVGPFYCPGDEKVYIDLSFFQELSQRFRAPGDFAQAYVIAHEVGHHVQQLLGTSDKVTQLQRRARSESQANDLSVRLELQADCYAGVWGFYAKQRNILDPGDLEEALGAASAIGDDRLQRETQGYAVPDSFTHGSSDQRMRWFRAGFDSGDLRRCDTFSTRAL